MLLTEKTGIFSGVWDRVRTVSPLVHCITNYVTANDCANLLLACGASPIMAGDPEEVEEITARCAALVLNIGTLRAAAVPALLAAGKTARALGHPVVLDPVGVGASALRAGAASQILAVAAPAAVRGNLSEVKALLSGGASGGEGRGVDAAGGDGIAAGDLDRAVSLAKSFARRFHCVAAVTGETDIVTDGERVFLIFNGCPMMRTVTGTGCQLSALTAALLGANPGRPLEAAAAAVCAMGVCGELAHSRLSPLDGNAAYRDKIIDAAFHLTGGELEANARYKIC